MKGILVRQVSRDPRAQGEKLTPVYCALTQLTRSFAKSLLNLLRMYGFDGVDLDWEYPVASDRGGSPKDMENYGKLIKQIRSTFDASGSELGISFTIPSSYWYLRHFDVPAYQQQDGADWANMMTYDLHGVWDGTDPYIGNIMGAHTNLTEIQEAMDLLWRNDVDPSKIVLGIGFYGRSFTLQDSSCIEPGCPFTGGGEPGQCTDTSGILSYKEIMEIVEDVDIVGPFWEETAAVMYVSWDGNQWVSYDNNVTMKQKVDWANDHCLGGVMIWALDQDTYDWQALSALLGEDVDGAALLEGGSESSLDAEEMAHAYNALPALIAIVLDYIHRASYGVITEPDDHLCKTGDTTEYEDSDSQYRLICCPTDAMPTCQWSGGSSTVYSFELVQDSYSDRTGSVSCTVNGRSLCCATDSSLDTLVNKCYWTECNGEYSVNQDPYSNCEWSTCKETCGNDKVLLTQRHALLSGGLPEYCDSGSVEYPDEDNFSYYFKDESTDNDESSGIETRDPYAFVMVDGDTDAYDESLVDQWEFLDDGSLNSKRDGVPREKRDIFTFREDTFDNVVETYLVRCANLYVNDTGCTTIFSGGASNTIVKMPLYHGSGPYARVISLIPQHSSEKRSNILPRDTSQVYELTVDYDLAAASEEEKGDVNFRIDYTNLLNYWEDITDSPADKKKKRWFGGFSEWLKKVTTIVKDSSGSLPLNYFNTIKLFHWDEQCSGRQMSLDIDASLDFGLDAQYAYYFEGAILPSPKMIASYAYFSVDPAAQILLTMRGEAAFQTSSDEIDIISGVTFPGLSIKGLISIGPELALTGRMDASMVVSGELNTGLVVDWPKAEVFFPQDSDGKAASVPPSTLKNNDKRDAPDQFQVTPRFEASASAEGNLALTLTPQVKFGISVLGGKLMDGYLTAGVENTVSLGVSASASTGLSSGSSAEFCYWADYDYSVFLQANASFLGDVAYWGDRYDVTSPEDPIALVDKTCLAYSSDVDEKRKSDSESSSALVANTTGSPFFKGWCECADKDTTIRNDTLSCLNSGGTVSKSKRQTSQCYLPPALFYNCDWFQGAIVNNLNSNTYEDTPFVSLIGICENIKNYLDRNSAKPNVCANSMLLTYKAGKGSKNRNNACSAKATECKNLKTSLWPANNQQPRALTMSCDEFPFNASEEGGTGAEVACVPEAQQKYQSKINNQISLIKEESTGKTWSQSAAGPKKYYTMNLYSYWANKNDIGTLGGSFDSSATMNPSGNPQYSLGNNGICIPVPHVYETTPGQKIYMVKTTPCQIQFETPDSLVARGMDPNNPDHWVITNVTLSDEPIDDDSPFKEIADLFDDIDLDSQEDHNPNDIEAESTPVQHNHHHYHHGSHGHHRLDRFMPSISATMTHSEYTLSTQHTHTRTSDILYCFNISFQLRNIYSG
ncbi:glycosyl hydrolases family 18-domain-containing protein [Aspergillus desertorum]